jgi:hypothetical protein
VPAVLKSGSLNLLEPSGPFHACNGIALSFSVTACKETGETNLNLKNKIKSRKINKRYICSDDKIETNKWAVHVAGMGEMRGVCRVLVGKPEGKRTFGRPRRRWEEIKKSGNACYHSMQNLFCSSLLSKNIKIKIYRTIILPVRYGCETWSLTLMEEGTLRVFENRVLRRIFGPKRDEVIW